MEKRNEKIRNYATTLASPAAGMISKLVSHPLDTLKAKLQANQHKLETLNDHKIGRAWQLAKKTMRQEGIRGFFRGVTISVLGSSVAFSLYMSAYERAKTFLNQIQFFHNNPSLNHLTSGLIAEAVSCTLWLPVDIIKERMQVQSEVKIYSYRNPIDAMYKINSAEGIIGLYRAFGATLLFFGPFSAIMFASYEKLKNQLMENPLKPTLHESMICSSISSALAAFLVTPLQIVKLRMQIQRADIGTSGGTLQGSIFGYRNAFHGLYLIVKKEGIFALYKGSVLRIFMVVPNVTLAFSLTEYFRQQILNSQVLERLI